MYSWCKYNFVSPKGTIEIASQIIWGNSWIQIEGSPVINEKAWRHGLKYVRDLFNVNGELLEVQQLQQKFNYGVSWFLYRQLLAALPTKWRETMSDAVLGPDVQNITTKYDYLYNETKISALVYSELISDETILDTRRNIWEVRLNKEIDNKEFMECFQNIYKTTICTKFRNFQWRLLHNIIYTNHILYIWKLSATQLCTFCKREQETVMHLFLECPIVKQLWTKLIDFIESLAPTSIVSVLSWDDQDILFNSVHPRANCVVNFLVLITKQFIYRQRCLLEPINFLHLKYYINEIQKTEFYIAKLRGKLQGHYKKWSQLDETIEVSNNEYIIQNQYIMNYINTM